MSDEIVVMDQGRIQQTGTPHDVYARPANAFVASFVGAANLLEGTVLGLDDGRCEVEIPLGPDREPLRLRAAGATAAGPGRRIVLSVRPEDLRLHLQRPPAAVNLLDGEVVDTVYLGNFLDCRVRVGAREISVRIDHYEQLAPGQTVFLTFEPDDGRCLPE